MCQRFYSARLYWAPASAKSFALRDVSVGRPAGVGKEKAQGLNGEWACLW